MCRLRYHTKIVVFKKTRLRATVVAPNYSVRAKAATKASQAELCVAAVASLVGLDQQTPIRSPSPRFRQTLSAFRSMNSPNASLGLAACRARKFRTKIPLNCGPPAPKSGSPGSCRIPSSSVSFRIAASAIRSAISRYEGSGAAISSSTSALESYLDCTSRPSAHHSCKSWRRCRC